MSLENQRHHEQQKYKYIAHHRDEFNGYGANAHGLEILDEIKKLNPQSICDVGTATGRFCIVLEQSGIKEVIGVDFAFEPENRGENVRWIKAYAHNIPLEDKSVDYVTAFDFLEHLLEEDVDNVLYEFKRIARKGFIFSVNYKKSCHEVDGENLHMTVRGPSWWTEKFKKYGTLSTVGRFFIITF